MFCLSTGSNYRNLIGILSELKTCRKKVMIDLYTWGTPNGHKIHIMLEETGIEYTVHPINIREGEQFNKKFLATCCVMVDAPTNLLSFIIFIKF